MSRAASDAMLACGATLVAIGVLAIVFSNAVAGAVFVLVGGVLVLMWA